MAFGILQGGGKKEVKLHKAIFATYETIDIVDAMTMFVAQLTQDIRVENFFKKYVFVKTLLYF